MDQDQTISDFDMQSGKYALLEGASRKDWQLTVILNNNKMCVNGVWYEEPHNTVYREALDCMTNDDGYLEKINGVDYLVTEAGKEQLSAYQAILAAEAEQAEA